MELNKFTKTSGEAVYINKQYIVAVTVKNADTCIYTADSSLPFHVKETVEEVLKEIKYR